MDFKLFVQQIDTYPWLTPNAFQFYGFATIDCEMSLLSQPTFKIDLSLLSATMVATILWSKIHFIIRHIGGPTN